MITLARTLARLGIGSTLLAGMLTVVLPSTLDAAQARCNGNTGVRSTLIYNGFTVVSEVPVSGSCNGNNLYQGRIRSHFQSWTAEVWIQNGGHWSRIENCSYSEDGCDYSYTDNNSHSYMVLCTIYPDLEDGTRRRMCGWGTNWRITSMDNHSTYYHGTNWGF